MRTKVTAIVQKLVVLLFFQLITGALLADTLEVKTLQPNWQENDHYAFQRVELNNYYVDDSLIRHDQTVKMFHIKVEQNTFSTTVQFYNDEANFERQKVQNLPVEKLLLLKLIEDISFEMFSFPYLLQLNDSLITHEPKVVNYSDYSTHLNVKIDVVFDRYKEVLNKSEEEIVALKKHAYTYMLQEEQKVREELLTNFKSIFAPHAYPCKMDTTLESESATKDIALFQEQPFQTIKAKETTSLTLKENQYTLKKERFYDKQDFLDKIKLVQPVFANIKPDQLTIIERQKMLFEQTSHWLLETNTEAIALLPGVKVVQVTTVQRLVP